MVKATMPDAGRGLVAPRLSMCRCHPITLLLVSVAIGLLGGGPGGCRDLTAGSGGAVDSPPISSEADAEAIYIRGVQYADRSDYVKAANAFEEAVAAGHAEAMARLGALYAQGLGVTQDLSEAISLFRRSVAAGSPEGMSHLGVAYLAGDGVERDPLKARELFEQGAALGDAMCMYNLGMVYLRGYGVEPDRGQAVEWLRRAESAGSVNARSWLEKHDDSTVP